MTKSRTLCALGGFILLMAFGQNMTPSFTGYDIIIVAGQSNAVGVGGARIQDELIPTGIDSKIFQLGRCHGQDLKVIAASDPLHHWDCESGSASKRGFGLAFARRYALYSLAAGRRVLIVPAAKSGSSILQWDPNINERPSSFKSSVLYSDMIRRIDRALAVHAGNRVVAFHWQQGETDMAYVFQPQRYSPDVTNHMRSASDYKASLLRLISGVRARVGKNVPVLIGEPSRQAPYLVPSFVSVMNTVTTQISCAKFVSSAGLYTNSQPIPMVSASDGVHFTGDGQIEMARRRYASFRELAPGCL